MTSARNKEPKVPRAVKGGSRSCGKEKSPPQNFFRSLVSNGKFWSILGGNFTAVELRVSHAYDELE